MVAYAVVGSAGKLGRELLRLLRRRGLEAVGLTRRDLDIADRAAVAGCRTLAHCEVIFNCAAYTDVDAAESDPQTALAVNGEGPGYLAEICRRTGGVLVHVSSDYVLRDAGLDARPLPPTAACEPCNAYGRSKLRGEAAVSYQGCRAIIVRTSWLFGGEGDFLSQALARLEQAGMVEAVCDQVGSPTFIPDLAEALLALVASGIAAAPPPLVHVVNRGMASRYLLACEAVKAAGLQAAVLPITAAEAQARFGRRAPRPAFTALDGSSAEAALGHRLRPWQEALADFVSQRRSKEVR